VGIFFSANRQAANINGPAIEIKFINEFIFLAPFLREIFVSDWCEFLLLYFIFAKSLRNPFFYEKYFFILEMTGEAPVLYCEKGLPRYKLAYSVQRLAYRSGLQVQD